MKVRNGQEKRHADAPTDLPDSHLTDNKQTYTRTHAHTHTHTHTHTQGGNTTYNILSDDMPEKQLLGRDEICRLLSDLRCGKSRNI